MKKVTFVVFLAVILIMIGACSESTDESVGSSNTSSDINKSEENNTVSSDSEEEDESESTMDDSNDISLEETKNEESNNTSGSEEANVLSEYSSEEIEYARVWLEIVGNKDIEELVVRHIPAEEQVNPYDDDSVDYPEDVIALGGAIMADGIVTYSGNGDGTINLYNVPSHWPSYKQIDESMEEYTEDIIKSTEQIYIDTGNDEEVIKLIQKLNIQS